MPQRLDELHDQQNALAAELAEHERLEAAAQAQFDACQTELRPVEAGSLRSTTNLHRVDKQHRHLESQLTRTRERIDVLTELHQRLEGLNSGVKEVLVAAQSEPAGPYGEVRGVVADLFHVDVDSAPLVDVALGEHAQYVVVSSAGRLFDWLNEKPLGVAGRVGFLRLDSALRRGEAAPRSTSAGEPGVMGRADRFVETAPEFVPLVERLLGRTWFVDRLSTALRLAQTAGRGLAFVTSDGELLAADGTLVVGPRQASAGLLSRRSEIRACHEQLAELEKQLAHQQHGACPTRGRTDSHGEQQLAETAATSRPNCAARLAEHRQQTAAARGQLQQAAHAARRVANELQAHGRAMRRQRVRSRFDPRASVVAAEQAAAHSSRNKRSRRSRACRPSNSGSQRSSRPPRKSKSPPPSANNASKCSRPSWSRPSATSTSATPRWPKRAQPTWRIAQPQLAELDAAMLAARQSLAELFLVKQHQAAELATQAARRRTLRRASATDSRASPPAIAAARRSCSRSSHKLDIATNKLRHQRQTLVERMQDDYGIDLAPPPASSLQRAGTSVQRDGRRSAKSPNSAISSTSSAR